MKKTVLKGSVSFYFVVAIVLIISVVMSVTEIARMNAQKLYLQIATDSAIDSMASLYHRKLNEYYNLYGVEYRTINGLVDEYFDFIYPYFVDEDVPIKNWYIANIEKENINLEINELVDNNYLEKEILKYMKYKLVGRVIEFFGKDFYIENENDISMIVDEANEVLEETKKSELYAEINKRYFDFKDDIKKLESYIKKASDDIEEANQGIRYMSSMSISGSESNAKTVSNKANRLNFTINELIENLDNFKDKMQAFRNVVEHSYAKYKDDVNTGRYEYNDDIKAFIELEFKRFIDFVDEDSPMNKGVEETKTQCDEIINIIREHNTMLTSYVLAFDRINDQLRYERSLSGEEHDSAAIRDLLDEKRDLQDTVSNELKDIKAYYRDLEIQDINVDVTTASHTHEENMLKKLIGFKDGIFLSLVMDSDKIDSIDDTTYSYSDFNILSNTNVLSVDKVILGEYELDKFNYFNKALNSEETKSKSEGLEVETLITGEKSDKDAISSVINRILLIRIAMNVLHIYANGEKRDAARNFAYMLFAGFSPILAEVMALLIITAWGTAQGLVDIKKLLNNKRVKFFHTNESWTLSVQSIIGIAESNTLGLNDGNNDDNDTGLAFSYKDYLRLLLFLENQSDVDERMAGIIEKNIKKEQSSFDFEKLVYSFAVDNKFICRHYFTNFVFVNATSEHLYEQYAIKTSAYRCYYDN